MKSRINTCIYRVPLLKRVDYENYTMKYEQRSAELISNRCASCQVISRYMQIKGHLGLGLPTQHPEAFDLIVTYLKMAQMDDNQ